MTEILFVAQREAGGGLVTRAHGHAIFTQADTQQLRVRAAWQRTSVNPNDRWCKMQSIIKSVVLSRFLAAGAVVVLGVAPIAAIAAEPVNTWPDLRPPAKAIGGGGLDAALLIGIERYTYLDKVVGARANIDAWASWLLKTRNVPQTSVIELYDADADADDINDKATAVAGLVKPGGTLWFVFVGHGLPAKDGTEGLLVGVDAKQNEHAYNRSVAQSAVLQRLIAGKQSKTIMILDSCFSGRDRSGEIVKGAQPLLPIAKRQLLPARVLMITAGASDQFAHQLPGAELPAFSYLMLGALRGWADSDGGNGVDGQVTAEEAVTFVRGALAQLPGGLQTPQLVPAGSGAMVLANSAGEGAPELRVRFNRGAGPQTAGPARPVDCPSGTKREGGKCIGVAECEVGARWDGTRCVRSTVAEVECPAGSRRSGTKCVAQVECPPGAAWNGKACVPGNAAAATPSKQPTTASADEAKADALLKFSYSLWGQVMDQDQQYREGESALAKAEAAHDQASLRTLRASQTELRNKIGKLQTTVLETLKQIERDYPEYPKLDEVLYSLGYHLGEMGRSGEDAEAYMRLIRKVPKSSYMPDAYLGIGNWFYGRNKPEEALKWYAKVSDYPESGVYGWGLYYTAWVAHQTKDWQAAILGFARVLDYSKNEKGGRRTFTDDATKYLVRSWAENGQPNDALKFFSKIEPGLEGALLQALAEHYRTLGESAKLRIIVAELISHAPTDPRRVKYLAWVLDDDFKHRDLQAVSKSAVAVGNAVESAPKAVQAEVDGQLAEIASNLHEEYEKKPAALTLETAEMLYQIYEAHFATGKNNYAMAHNHALALFQLAELAQKASTKPGKPAQGKVAADLRGRADSAWRKAAAAYERVNTMQPAGKYAEPAAHRAFISYFRISPPDPKSAAKPDGTADLAPIPLSADERSEVAACDRYVSIALKNNAKEDVPEALFVCGRLWYQHNYFAKSAPLFASLLEQFADHALALDAAKLLLSSLHLAGDGKALMSWTQRLLQDPRFNKGELGKTLGSRMADSDYYNCWQLNEKVDDRERRCSRLRRTR